MNIDHLEKDESIKNVIAKLYEKLGENYFDIVDHWRDDLTAIGIGNRSNNKVLVYISTLGDEKDHYDVQLELPPSSDDDFPYTDAGQFSSVNFEKLVEIIKKHINESGL